jgi:hypothetical protein
MNRPSWTERNPLLVCPIHKDQGTNFGVSVCTRKLRRNGEVGGVIVAAKGNHINDL